MSKMRMPEMSVVRFEESDVICASIVVSGTNDKTAHNMMITYNGTPIFSNSRTNAFDNIKNYFSPVESTTNNFEFFNGEYYHNQTWLQSSDSEGEAQNWDGIYTYTSNGYFDRIIKQ